MAFHRIKKYSRQVVSQDCILSCQPKNIEEIPVFKRAQVSGVSLRNQRASSGGDRLVWLERESDLSSMLVCWHLWNSRAVPRFPTRKKTDNQRRTVPKSSEKVCQSLCTLRDQSLHMSMEKYLLFLMPREMTRKRVAISLNQSFSRRDRFCLSALYVNTALGLCQYLFKERAAKNAWSHEKEGGRRFASRCFASQNNNNAYKALHTKQSFVRMQNNTNNRVLPNLSSLSGTLSPERILFPDTHEIVQERQDCLKSKTKRGGSFAEQRLERSLLRDSRGNTLSLHCPSVLNSPDIQDIAQSGLMTLEGSLTLEFF